MLRKLRNMYGVQLTGQDLIWDHDIIYSLAYVSDKGGHRREKHVIVHLLAAAWFPRGALVGTPDSGLVLRELDFDTLVRPLDGNQSFQSVRVGLIATDPHGHSALSPPTTRDTGMDNFLRCVAYLAHGCSIAYHVIARDCDGALAIHFLRAQ